jgi:hypothetical protein
MIEQPYPQEQPQQEQPLPQPEPPAKNNRKKLLVTGAVVLSVLVLAGAAFLAGTLMNRKANRQNGMVTSIQGPQGVSGGVPAIAFSDSAGSPINFTPAKELPSVQPDVSGLLVKRDGNSITIGTGMISISIGAGGSAGSSEPASADPQTSYDGPAYEVVITKDTLVYKDTTPFPEPGSSTDAIQQTVAPGSLDELNSMSNISVWGKKTGDRYVADIILYTQPMIKVK